MPVPMPAPVPGQDVPVPAQPGPAERARALPAGQHADQARAPRADQPRAPRAERARALHAEGVTATARNHPAVAVRRLRAALRALPAGEPELRGRILVSLAHAEAEQGHIPAGLALLDEAEPLLPPQRQGVLRGQRGLLLLRIGRGEEALRQLDAAVALLRRGTEPAELARILLNRSVVHLLGGRIAAARSDLHRCADLAGQHGLTRMAAKANHNLGYLAYLAGDLPSALRTFDAVAGAYRRVAPAVLPVLAVDRARALLAAGLYRYADAELATALTEFTRHRLSQDHAEALLARAETALLAGRPGPARQYALRARSGFRRRQNELWTALASLTVLRAEFAAGPGAARAARLAADAGQLAGQLRALGLREDALVAALVRVRALLMAGAAVPVGAVRGKSGKSGGPGPAGPAALRDGAPHPGAAGVAAAELVLLGTPPRGGRLDVRLLWRLVRAELAAASGRAAEQGRELRSGLAELQRHTSQLGAADLQTGSAVHGQALAAAGLAAVLRTGTPAVVFGWAELARAQAMLLGPVRPPEDRAAAAALEELRHARVALRDAELAGRPAAALRSRCSALQRTIREHAWFAAGSGQSAKVAPLSRVRDALAGRALVSYLRDGPRLAALVVTGRSAAVVGLGPYAPAAEVLRRLRADLDAIAGRALPERMLHAALDATRRDAAALASLVLAPLLRRIGDRDLVAVPTGELMTIPWRLLDGCAGRPVTVSPSATVWLAAGAAPPGTGPGLLVAGPGTRQGEAEVAAIAALRPAAAVLTGAAATPAATLAALDGAGVAHIASHGSHEPDNALFSCLHLAGGPLMGYDLQRLAAAPRTVVLSSCDVGLTDVRPGDEALGMVSALLTAGSSTVLASVGRVSDEVAVRVMTEYHRQVTVNGAGPAQALAAASAPEPLSSFVCFGAG